MTIQYLTEQFASLGLEPGGVGGTWVQEVPLVAITADPDMSLSIGGAGGTTTFEYGSQFVAGTPRVVESVGFENSEMVFVGYLGPELLFRDRAGLWSGR